MAKSNKFHNKLIKEIFRYIKNSLSRNIIYRKRYQNENLILIASINSDWAGSLILENKKSISKYIFFLFKNSIS
jgi:hypothetical protein